MYALLLLLSVISTAAGLFAIGFGLAPYELSLGNALIVAGAVGIVGGMVLFGLAAAVRQLRRIADAVGPRPGMARRPAPTDGAEARQPPPGQRGPNPQRAAPAEIRETRNPEPRPTVAAALEGLAGLGLERLEPGFAPARMEEPPRADEDETVPFAPTRAAGAPAGRGAPPRSEPGGDARPSPADIMARLSNLAAPPRLAPQRKPAPAERAAPEQGAGQKPNMFDALWPADGRGARQSQPEAIARAPRAEARPEPRVETKLEVKPEKQAPRGEPPVSREPPASTTPRERSEPAAAASAPEMRPIAILKSGVIDGMAYTLYTDGSIEAELPQGTMRFASIDELRSHLENAERHD